MYSSKFWMALLLVAVISYLLGSLNAAIIVSRLYAKDDVRRHGSGSAGMTNMLRTYGIGPAVMTAVVDFLKAVVAIVLARIVFYLIGMTPETGFPLDAGYVAGLFALLGHLFPLYFKFKGGKGVMTSLGTIFMTNPIAFLIIVVIFVPLVFLTRIVSIGSILGAVAYPFLTWAVLHFRGREPLWDTVCAAVISCIIIYMHRENIARLLNGTENKFGGKSKKRDKDDPSL